MKEIFKRLITKSDAAMGDIGSQHSSVQSAMNEIALTKSEGIVPQYTCFNPVLGFGRNRFAFLNEGPIGFVPSGIFDFTGNGKHASRGIKYPPVGRIAGVLQASATAGGGYGTVKGPIAISEVHAILSGVDDDIGTLRGGSEQGGS